MADNNDSTSSCEQLPETPSRCITESVTATFDFKVTNYPDVRFMDVGEYISSPIFRVGGHSWTIQFYPNGEFKKYRGQVFRVGSDLSEGWGYHKFASEKKLKSLSLLADGCFTIRCVLTVMESSPLPELHGNLERMLRDGGLTDVTFIVGGQPFRAHRAILAVRSPIFEAQLFDPATEEHIVCVEVVDMEPSIFEMLLHFVYTDLLPPCSNGEGHDALVLQRLLVRADRYGLDRLKLMCEDELCKRIDAETVTVTFALADRHNYKQLRSACLNFMARPEVLETILASDGFKNLHLGTQ